MGIDLSVTQEVAAPPERVWARLLDSAFIAACAPGLDAVEPAGDHRFRAVVGLGAGPFRMKLPLEVGLSDLVPPRSVRLAVTGKARGVAIDAKGTVTLVRNSAGRTTLTHDAAVDLSGALVTFAGPSLPAKARALAGQFWRTFAEKAAEPSPA